MIPSGFYPTDYTLSAQNLELTKTIPNIPITTESFSDAYWLGWVYYDNLPSSYHVSSFDRDDDTGVCTWEDMTEVANYPVGYCGFNMTSSGGINASRPVELTHNNGSWTAASSSNSYSSSTRLPNDLDINTTTWSTMLIVIYGEATDGNTTSQVFARIDCDNQLLTGSYTVTVSHIYGSYASRQVTINLDDFENGTCEFTQDGYTYKLSIIGFEPVYLRDISTQGSAQYYVTPHPMVLIRDDREREHLIGVMASPYITRTTGMVWGGGEFFNGFYISISRGNPYDGSYQDFYDNDYRFYGGMVGSYTLQELNENVSGTTKIFYPENSNFIIAGLGRSDVCALLRSYTIGDVRRTIALATRFSQSGTTVYQNSSNELYAHVSEDNEFLCELVDGSPQSVQNELREWQIIGNTIVDNNFDPADIPPYEPPSPGSDLEELGDDIDIQKPSIGVANNFLTMYALTEAQVSNFGSVLWTSWVEEVSPGEWSLTKMIDNFTAGFDLLTTTASFDIASVLQFIVSLRVYPFSLINLNITQSAGQVAYIGRGEYGINCGGGQNILKFTESMGYLNAGSLTVPRHFGDWRDHDNTTVMAYLPYCGTVELNPSDVVGRTLVCTYAVDVYTGQCMAIIESYSPEDLGGKHYPIAIASGTIGVSIPVSTTNSGQIAGAFINSAMNVMQIISGAATDAAMQIAGAELAMNSKSMSRQSTTYKEAYAQQQAAEIATNLGNAGLGVENEALGYLSSKGVGFPTLSGGSGLTSFMEPSSAYIQIRRGLYKTNDQYDHTNGKPSTDARPLSSYIGTGLTICNNVDVSGLTCHEYEKAAIKEMLASGVYL